MFLQKLLISPLLLISCNAPHNCSRWFSWSYSDEQLFNCLHQRRKLLLLALNFSNEKVLQNILHVYLIFIKTYSEVSTRSSFRCIKPMCLLWIAELIVYWKDSGNIWIKSCPSRIVISFTHKCTVKWSINCLYPRINWFSVFEIIFNILSTHLAI